MHPQLQAIVDDLDAASRRLQALRADTPCDAWSRRPAVGQWSPAECLEHLNLTSKGLLPLLRSGLREARDGGPRTQAPYRRDLMGWLVWTAMAPASAIKTKTIAAFVPAAAQSVDVLIADFERLQDDVAACVREADGLRIDRIKLASPFDARVKYNLYAVLTLVPRHQHRHLLQAERATRILESLTSALAV